MTEDAIGATTWMDHTTAFDRVRSVASTISQPRPASYIATESSVGETTARSHLERLVEMNVLLKSDHEGTVVYQPDPLHTRARATRELLDKYDHDGLIQLKEELQEQITTWRDEYGATSPDELRERAADTDEVAETRDIRKTASDWGLVAYRLDIVEDAIEDYARYNCGNLE